MYGTNEIRNVISIFIKFGSVIVLFLSISCNGKQQIPRYNGIVRSHINHYQSGTDSSADLMHSNQLISGYDFPDGQKKGWRSAIQWEFVGRQETNDVYTFQRDFTLSDSKAGGASKSKIIHYDGAKSVVIFQDDYEVISIEPGSLPLQ